MLAEIFVLQLETRLRVENETAEAEKRGFVHLSVGALPDSRKREAAGLKKFEQMADQT